MAAVEQLQLGLRYPGCDGLEVHRRRYPVVFTPSHEYRDVDLCQALPGVMPGPCGKLLRRAAQITVFAHGFPGDIQQSLPSVRILSAPGFVPAHVRSYQLAGDSIVRVQIRKLMKRIGSTTLATGGSTRQHKRLDAIRIAQGKFLGDHPTERYAHDRRRGPIQCNEQRVCIRRVVRH